MKIIKIILTATLLLLMVSCSEKDDKVESEIYENSKIVACGVKNPLSNIKWLSDMDKSNVSLIFLYRDKETDKDYIEVVFKNNDTYHNFRIKVFTCDNTELFRWSGPPSNQYEDFFKTKQEIGVIYEKKQ